MKRNLTALLPALGLAILLFHGWHGAIAATQAGVLFAEFPLPDANGQPRYLIATGPGELWFTLPGTSAIGRLVVTTTADYAFTRYDTPTPNSQPDHLVYLDGRIWFTEYGANRIGALDIASGQITEYVLPSPDSRPTGIDALPNGDIWVVTEAADSLVRRTVTGAMTEFTDPLLIGALLSDVEAEDEDTIWLAAPGRNELYSYWPNRAVKLVKNFPGPLSKPYQIDRNLNRPWIIDTGQDYIGRFAPGTLTLWRWYPVNATGVGLADIFYRNVPGGRQVWFTERDANRISQMTLDGTTGAISQFWRQPLPESDSLPTGVAVDDAGTVWIALSGRNKIMAWLAPYYDFPNQLYLPAARYD